MLWVQCGCDFHSISLYTPRPSALLFACCGTSFGLSRSATIHVLGAALPMVQVNALGSLWLVNAEQLPFLSLCQ